MAGYYQLANKYILKYKKFQTIIIFNINII